jgi:hypothetical protein
MGLWNALARFSGLGIASTAGSCVWSKCHRSPLFRATTLAAQLGVVCAIALVAAWSLAIRPS